MKVFNALAGLAVAAGLVTTGLAAPAQASVTPVIYNYADGWMSPMIRPNATGFGHLGSNVGFRVLVTAGSYLFVLVRPGSWPW